MRSIFSNVSDITPTTVRIVNKLYHKTRFEKGDFDNAVHANADQSQSVLSSLPDMGGNFASIAPWWQRRTCTNG